MIPPQTSLERPHLNQNERGFHVGMFFDFRQMGIFKLMTGIIQQAMVVELAFGRIFDIAAVGY
jgi:hypothetical protein